MIHKDNHGNVHNKTGQLQGGRTNQYGEDRHIAGPGGGNKPAGPDKTRKHP
jgi:hypothetical protein